VLLDELIVIAWPHVGGVVGPLKEAVEVVPLEATVSAWSAVTVVELLVTRFVTLTLPSATPTAVAVHESVVSQTVPSTVAAA
jgi:hypothetical protein